MKKFIFSILCLVFLFAGCNEILFRVPIQTTKAPSSGDEDQVVQFEENKTSSQKDIYTAGLPLEQIILPPGFKISVFADNVPNARSLALGDNGTVFVSTRKLRNVYALRDEDKDGHAEKKYIIADNLDTPNGVAIREGDLYLAQINRVLKFRDIEEHLDNPPEPEVINDNYPTDRHHGWKFIRFGPDGKLYVPVGAPCNICERDDQRYASITRMNPDGSESEIFAHGVRNTVGFDWHPETQELWFTDNGRDLMGDDIPPDELNKAPQKGMHFGYPYCHGSDVSDPQFGSKRECSEFTAPMQNLGPHVAALGMRFYTGSKFPPEYKNQIFIAEHGSWNRSKKIGYRVMLVRLNNDKVVSYEPFAEGWLQGETVWGRPVDVLNMPDGSLLISDDYAGVVYRVWYENQ